MRRNGRTRRESTPTHLAPRCFIVSARMRSAAQVRGRGVASAEHEGVVSLGRGPVWMPRSRVDRARQGDWNGGAPRPSCCACGVAAPAHRLRAGARKALRSCTSLHGAVRRRTVESRLRLTATLPRIRGENGGPVPLPLIVFRRWVTEASLGCAGGGLRLGDGRPAARTRRPSRSIASCSPCHGASHRRGRLAGHRGGQACALHHRAR